MSTSICIQGERFLEQAEKFLDFSSEPEVIEEAREVRLEEAASPISKKLQGKSELTPLTAEQFRYMIEPSVLAQRMIREALPANLSTKQMEISQSLQRILGASSAQELFEEIQRRDNFLQGILGSLNSDALATFRSQIQGLENQGRRFQELMGMSEIASSSLGKQIKPAKPLKEPDTDEEQLND